MKYCVKCGKQMAQDAAFCAYCGTRAAETEVPPQPQPRPQPQENNSMAIVAMVCGILSVFAGPLLGIVAIVLAQSSKKETGGVMTTYAKIGFYIGLVEVILGTIAIALVFLYIFVFSVLIF